MENHPVINSRQTNITSSVVLLTSLKICCRQRRASSSLAGGTNRIKGLAEGSGAAGAAAGTPASTGDAAQPSGWGGSWPASGLRLGRQHKLAQGALYIPARVVSCRRPTASVRHDASCELGLGMPMLSPAFCRVEGRCNDGDDMTATL